MEDIEFWVPVQSFPLYQVSNTGLVRRFATGKLMNQSLHNKGYLKVSLQNEQGSSRLYVHRLVLQHFVNNPHSKPQADHIDGDRTNNHVSNLRWASAQENAFNRVSISPNMPKGVTHSRNKANPYRASIRINGKSQPLGVFATAEEAGEAYRIRAESVQHEFAVSKRPTKTLPTGTTFEVVFVDPPRETGHVLNE